MLTPYGPLAALRVPNVRRGNGELDWHSLRRSERCWGPLLDQQVMGSCLGLSLRDLQEMRALTLGEVLSLAACNRIVSSVMGRVEACTRQPLASPPPVVLVDGMWVKSASPPGAIKVDAQGRRRAAKHQQKRVVRSALGVWPDGHWEIVSWQSAQGETAEAWQAVLHHLQAKGVTPETTPVVVSDGATGLERALDRYLLGVPHQRCIFHTSKNLAEHLVFGDLEVEAAEATDQALRQAKRARKQAI